MGCSGVGTARFVHASGRDAERGGGRGLRGGRGGMTGRFNRHCLLTNHATTDAGRIRGEGRGEADAVRFPDRRIRLQHFQGKEASAPRMPNGVFGLKGVHKWGYASR